jgi:formylglycine-generating enzyme required for sulfatase activity
MLIPLKKTIKKIRIPLMLTVLCVLFPFVATVIYSTIKSRQRKIYDSILHKPVTQKKIKTEPGKSFTNSVGMKFIYIPAGRFIMGSPENEIGRDQFEIQRKVVLTKGFYLQTTEVTQRQWKAVIEKNPSRFKGDNLPVEQVSWFDCKKFIRRLNQMEVNGKYRLPTEAEWEYACRSGTTTSFSSGPLSAIGKEIDPNLDRVGWYWGNSGGSSHRVGEKEPNAWGLYDMHGNVWEWCQDRYESWYGKFSYDPISDPQGPNRGRFRVFRGGSWFAGVEYNRSADRRRANPDFRSCGIGFRMARSE